MKTDSYLFILFCKIFSYVQLTQFSLEDYSLQEMKG